MNDRYLFRAKRIDNGEWIVGDLSHHKTGKVFVKPLNGSAISTCEVDKDTICQCTGLKDKTGKKIWENDVVKCIDKNSVSKFIAVVEFGNPNSFYSWGYQLKHIKGDKPNMDILLWIDMEETGATCEVIGNIFETQN